MGSNYTSSGRRLISNVAVLLILLIASTDSLIPEFIHVCRKSDPQVEQCINNSIEALRPRLLKGIPELDVPPLEPLALKEVVLSRGPSNAKIEAVARNIKVKGPGTFVITALKTDILRNHYDFKLLLPRLEFIGDYTMNMRILLLNLQGKGQISGNLTNYKADVSMKGDKIEKNGKKYLQMRKMKAKLEVGDVSLHLSNLFNGDPVLGPATNRILNANAKLFLEEIQPALESSISDVFTDIANRITLKFTYDELFP